MGVISIFRALKEEKRDFFGSVNKDKLKLLEIHLNKSFEQVKEQFEDHLETINENTNEIQSNFEYLCELDMKIDKLSEKIDELNNLIRLQRGENTEKKTFSLKPLTKKEKEVFYALYILTEQRKYTTYKEISRRACYSNDLIAAYITNLIEKGVPVIKKYSNRIVYLSLDQEFRQLQAKENIVGVNTLLTHWVR